MKTQLKRLFVPASVVAATPPAYAGSVSSDDAFYSFMVFMENLLRGAFGIGLALAAFLVGAFYGVHKNNPLPALAGLVLAAFLHWGPTIIKNIILAGALV